MTCCEIIGDKGCISFLKGKMRDAYGNNTYLMRAGHFCSWYNDWRMNQRDKDLYELLLLELRMNAGSLIQPYKNDDYGYYVSIKGKGFVLSKSWMKFIIFEK